MNSIITNDTVATTVINPKTGKVILTLYREKKAIFQREYKTFAAAERIITLYIERDFVPGNK